MAAVAGSMSFHMSSCSVERAVCGRKSVRVLALSMPPVMSKMKRDGGERKNSSKTVGIIGGASVESTLEFLNDLVHSGSMDGGDECVPFVVCSDPSMKRELVVRERSGGCCEVADDGHVAESLRRKVMFLEGCGAGLILMPCHVSHLWYDLVYEASSVPVLHMGECVALDLAEANLKPLEAGGSLAIGVLSAIPSLASSIYQKPLQKHGFDMLVLDKATMEHTISPAIKAKKREDMDGARNLLRVAVQVLIVRGVNGVIIASEELKGILPRDDPLLRRCINPLLILANSTYKWANGSSAMESTLNTSQ